MARQPRDIEQALRQAIERADVTCYRLSQLTGVSRGVLSNFLSGKRSLTLGTAARLAKALRLEIRPVDER